MKKNTIATDNRLGNIIKYTVVKPENRETSLVAFNYSKTPGKTKKTIKKSVKYVKH